MSEFENTSEQNAEQPLDDSNDSLEEQEQEPMLDLEGDQLKDYALEALQAGDEEALEKLEEMFAAKRLEITGMLSEAGIDFTSDDTAWYPNLDEKVKGPLRKYDLQVEKQIFYAYRELGD